MAAQQKEEIKHIADIVGEWGKWQFILFAYSFSLCAVSAFVNMGYSFHAKNVDFWCSDAPNQVIQNNITKEIQCQSYENPDQKCTEWTFNTRQYKRSIVTEFNLVCDQSNYASLTQASFMLGYVVSGVVVSYYSDKYGRQPVVWFAFIIELIGIISCGLSLNIYQYMFSRFLVGLGHSSGGWAIFTIVIECCGPKHRSDITIFSGVGWVLGYALIPGFAFWLQDFRYIQMISALPVIVVMIWFWFMYESPRWQIIKGQTDRAEHTIRKALKMNGKSDQYLKDYMRQLTQNTEQEKNEQKSYNLLDLVKTPNIRKYSLIIWYSWIVNALIYYGLSFNLSDFGGNFYITFLLSGLVELPCQLFTPFLLKYFGRKTLYSISMFILALSSVANIPTNTEWLKVMFALISKYVVATSWLVLSIYGCEIYPTIIRSTGNGMASVIGRIGAMSAPFMGNLAMNTSLTYVMILYATLSTINGVLGLLLPETKDRELPDTIEEAENFEIQNTKTIDKNQSLYQI